MHSIKQKILLILLLIAIAGCAKMGPPPGGAVDEFPPEVLSTYPLPNSTNVSTEEEVLIEFDEAIRAESVSQAFSLSPPPPGTVRGKWKGKMLSISFDPPLLDDQTYVIVLGTQLSDQRGNKLEESISLAFSTGDKLDQGYLEGHLIQLGGAPVQGWRISGYFLDKYTGDSTLAPDPSVQIPDAATQADADGGWQLRNLREGRWRVFAYEDRDEDLLWTPGLDKLAVPGKDLFTSDIATAEKLILVGSERPATPFPMRLSSFTRNLAFFRFDKAIKEIDGVFNAECFNIGESDSGKIAGIPVPVDIKEIYIDPADSNRLRIHLDGNLAADSLRISVKGNFGGPEELDTFLVTGLKYTLEADTIPPELVTIIPEEMSRIYGRNNIINFYFSEEMKALADSAVFLKADDDTIKLNAEQDNPFHFSVIAPDTITSEVFDIILFGDHFSDLYGNTLEDSIITAKYEKLPADSIGSLSGITTSSMQGKIFLILKSTFDKNPDINLTIDQPGAFTFDQVPAGDWILEGWQDRDNNLKYTIGEAYPYEIAEPYTINFDTLHVRARWESGEVKLNFPD